MENRRHSVELAEIFAVHHQEYLKHHELHPVQSKAYRAIMACRSSALGGHQSGAVAVLHTWGQTLTYHPHIHMIVPAGGLSEDRSEWIPSAKNFLVPVKVLSAVFRRILCTLLDEALTTGRLTLPDGCAPFGRIKAQCYAKPWVVYCQKPFSTANSLIKYLGNYTHRIAIGNDRLVAHEHGKVSFTYKEYKSNAARRILTLDAQEFIRRFLQHILPTGFSKIRYFGFMALSVMKTNLAQCYTLIGQSGCLPALEGLTGQEVFRVVTGIDPLRCTSCKTGIMRPFGIMANDTG